ncbi:MAG TPA: hypothetical protein VGN00_29620 [Puia sp.]
MLPYQHDRPFQHLLSPIGKTYPNLVDVGRGRRGLPGDAPIPAKSRVVRCYTMNLEYKVSPPVKDHDVFHDAQASICP